jgi:5-methyltetrahydropteroyltriglutamate--homocysteine methyltransferase
MSKSASAIMSYSAIRFANRRSIRGDRPREFPDIINKLLFENEGGRHLVMPNVEGPIELRDKEAVQRDINNFKAALDGASPDSAFIAAVTPGQCCSIFPISITPRRGLYRGRPKALSFEYKAIVDAGFNLQLDAPTCPCARIALTGASGPRT